MTHTDLIKRLRRADEYDPVGHDAWEAADALSDLQAENQRLRSALESAAHALDDYSALTGRTIETFASKAARDALRSTEANHDN